MKRKIDTILMYLGFTLCGVAIYFTLFSTSLKVQYGLIYAGMFLFPSLSILLRRLKERKG
jgi:hypothetical protein